MRTEQELEQEQREIDEYKLMLQKEARLEYEIECMKEEYEKEKEILPKTNSKVQNVLTRQTRQTRKIIACNAICTMVVI